MKLDIFRGAPSNSQERDEFGFPPGRIVPESITDLAMAKKLVQHLLAQIFPEDVRRSLAERIEKEGVASISEEERKNERINLVCKAQEQVDELDSSA